jgi:2-haloalkanoic acid dehalogenase type II
MPDVTRFTTLTFDCYGTLIDWERGIVAELRPWVDRHGRRDLDDNALLEAFGTIEAACEAETPDKVYPEILAEAHRRLADKWGIRADSGEATEFGQSVGRWPAFADSATSLQYLKRYYKLVILSNVDRASFAESNRRLGVEFDLVVTAQDVGSYKPDRRNFEHLLAALGRMGVDKRQLLHTAQSLFHDIAPAKALGLKTAWITRRRGKAGGGATPAPEGDATPDLEVASLGEFAELHRREARG